MSSTQAPVSRQTPMIEGPIGTRYDVTSKAPYEHTTNGACGSNPVLCVCRNACNLKSGPPLPAE